jgi:hypothetical protein
VVVLVGGVGFLRLPGEFERTASKPVREPPSLLIIDVQPSFTPPQWLIDGIRALIGTQPSAATVEQHDESKTPFQKHHFKRTVTLDQLQQR